MPRPDILKPVRKSLVLRAIKQFQPSLLIAIKVTEDSMGDGTKDKTFSVYEAKGQLRVTVPKVLATAVGIMKGDKVKWIIDRGELVVKRVLER